MIHFIMKFWHSFNQTMIMDGFDIANEIGIAYDNLGVEILLIIDIILINIFLYIFNILNL